MRAGEQCLAGPCDTFVEVGPQEGDARPGEGCHASASSLAEAGHVWPGAEVDRAGGQVGQFADPQPGRDGQGEECLVATPGPGRGVRGGEERFGLVVGEVVDRSGRNPLGWDREDPADGLGVFGMVGQRVGQDGADRGQTRVAGGDGVAADGLDFVEKPADQVGVQHGEVDRVRFDVQGCGGVLEQQPPGVAVGGDGVRAEVTRGGGVVCEVALQRRGEGCHDRLRCASSGVSRRAAARAISSGVAVRYQ